jgi:hypothetical protein
MDGKLDTFAASSHLMLGVCIVTVHKFAPFLLHPWSMGGLDVIIVSVPFLWIITPSLPGLNIVVYPFSAILFTLKSDFFSPGSMLASLAFVDSCRNGSCVVLVACNVELSGRYTLLWERPVLGKFKSSLM